MNYVGSLKQDKEKYVEVYSDIHYQLRHTLSNYDCLDIDEIDKIIIEKLEDIELRSNQLYYNNEEIKNFHMFVFEIKKTILSQLGG